VQSAADDDDSEDTAAPARAEAPLETGLRVGQDRIDALFAASNRLLILAGQVRAQPDAVEEIHDASARAATAWQRLRRELVASAEARGAQIDRDLTALDDAMDTVRRRSVALLGEAMRGSRDLDRVSGDVSRGVRELRMRPFADAIAELPRLARDVAAETQKEVRVEMRGESVQADRTVLAQLREALMHLVRNAIDHGIESPAARRARGKSPEGMIQVAAALIGDRIVVTVRDDGAGLDVQAIRRRLAEREVDVPEDDRAVANMLFLGGVSTRGSATAISGRGVGLDAVRAAMERVRGSVSVEWVPGEGTTFTLEAPLTLATVRVILTRVSGIQLAIPAAYISRLIRIQRSRLRIVEGRAAIETEGAPAPVVSAAAILGPPLVDRLPEGAATLALVQVGERRVALRVDELIEESEVVVRPIRAHGRVAVPHLSGAALLAGGSVALVLNVPAAIATALGLPGEPGAIAEPRAEQATRRRVLVVDDSITTRTLESSVLEAAGYEVLTAVDGADGWRLLQERGADLVVSDVEMPRMDGIQLTEAMRAAPRFRETPIILVTGLESAEHRSRGLEAGADAYLGKSSFEQEGLLETVRELLG
jgi:two-component system chemotaxis sensor kinase CheA